MNEHHINPVLADNAPLLHAATRAWQRLPVIVRREGSVPLELESPGDRDMFDECGPGDLVIIPNYGLWHVALVIGTDHTHKTHVQVACVGHAQTTPHLQLTSTYPSEPGVFFVQRNNCYRPGLRAAPIAPAALPPSPSHWNA